MLTSYLSQIITAYNRGDAREESYYHVLERLIADYASARHKKISVTILPKKTEAGNPDFRIWDGKFRIIGYIEAKDFGKNLDDVEDSDQLLRYRTTFPNVILTNFTEFRLYRDGQLIDKIRITRHTIAQKLKVVPPLEKELEFYNLLERFFSFSLPDIGSARTLALELAKRTRFLRDEIILIELEEEQRAGRKAISGFYEAFKKFLIGGTLNPQQFADLYAQTIAYGLFAARTRSNNEFNREMAFKYIPHTIGILRDVFRFISMEDAPKSLGVIVDDIAEVLQVTDVNKILHDYFVEGKGKDPIIHFYETFLAAYDPETRERRGVYYTPEPVVGYIVRAIHSILKTHFHLPDGFASSQVTVLDPAAGTLTFLAEAIKLAVKEFIVHFGEGGKKNFIKNQILPNFFAFELMMAPYAIGHLKISFLLDELGYRLQDNERFNLYLTNALEMEELTQTEIPGIGSLSEESHLASKVKKEQPVLVILGNPPYSGISANINDWTEKLLKEDIDGMQSYYTVDSKPLGEKKLWLQDDYVKFLRFAQWKIHQAGHGIVGMVTNHSYLDNPTFRGMRQSLMYTFNEIYILDLHGNSLKKETAPDGTKDENVFDIRQGVAIALFVKMKNKKGCKVFHGDLYGLREEKYQRLKEYKYRTKTIKNIRPETPWYFFKPIDISDIAEYLNWKKVNEIFPVNNVGIVTARDKFAIDFNLNTLKNRIMQFRNLKIDGALIKETYKLKDTSTFKLEKFRNELSKIGNWEDHFQLITYRPFDIRHIYYSKWVIERPIYDTMRHMLKENISLCFMRQFSGNMPYSHFIVSENMVDNRTFFSSKGIIQQAPLYLYQAKENNPRTRTTMMMVFDEQAKYYIRSPNIEATFYEQLYNTFKIKPSPEDILYYIYGIFYSNTYRKKYSEFLKIDFPRVPFTSDYELFKQMGKYGKQLSELHLLKSERLNKPIAKYQGAGENDRIEKVQYHEKAQRIYINQEKYFEGIPPEIWNYYIGGYQVCNKWLKDRKGRMLLLAEIETYCKIVTAICMTIKIQQEIDQMYDHVENSIQLFS